MVTSIDRSRAPAPMATKAKSQATQLQQGPSFPLSSPPTESLATLKPSNGNWVVTPPNSFLPQNTFASSPSDDGSGSSSGQDEFHLDRYSQETNWTGQNDPSYRNQPKQSHKQSLSRSKSDKKPRPGLNIVTSFSTRAKRSQTGGLVVDEVQSQRPQLRPTYTDSIVSAKAEHVHYSIKGISSREGDRLAFDNTQVSLDGSDAKKGLEKRRIGREAVSRLQELRAARQQAAEPSAGKDSRLPSQTLRSQQSSQNQLQNGSGGTHGYSPDARSIVIGLSVPEHEANAHRFRTPNDSATSVHTPETPAIVITPAEETESWKPAFFHRPRPASRIFARNHTTERQIRQDEHPPPVPSLPRRNGAALPEASARIDPDHLARQPNHEEDSEFEDEEVSEGIEPGRRASSESQEHILPNNDERGRHKSQGWWNLMLSPMLSRKGTILDKGGAKDHGTPPLPPMPAMTDTTKAGDTSSIYAESPETPRRLGLASARASVWSRWTSWEKERGSLPEENPRASDPSQLDQRNVSLPESEKVAFMKFAREAGNGLAAEYYHACAVELLSGIRYFDCQNHSCTEKLPLLHSIFDDKAIVQSGSEENLSDRSVGHAEITDTEPPRTESVGAILPEANDPSSTAKAASTVVAEQAREIKPAGSAADLQDQPSLEASNVWTDAEPPRDGPGTSLTPARFENEHRELDTGTAPHASQAVSSPGPVSPAMLHAMASHGAVPMAQIDQAPNGIRSLDQTHPQGWGQTQPSSVHYQYNTTYTSQPLLDDAPDVVKPNGRQMESASVVREVVPPPSEERQFSKSEDPDAAKKPSFLSKSFHYLRRKKSTENEESKIKKRRWTLLVGIPLFLIIIACILLATLLTRKGTGTPVQSQWLNLTGYPAIPTGISTIARPDAVTEQSQCVRPTTMWSCALPPEAQPDIAPNDADQPNFRFEITFRNGTVPANMTIPVGSLARRADDPFTNDLFDPDPAPPSRADQIFMGNTTDNITQPFQGEVTPFYMTFIPVFPVDPSNTTDSDFSASRLLARQAGNLSNDIPAPDVLSDGSAAPANLLPVSPFPTSQPIQLYNRGQVDEHYGFYMYYDKAIFLQSTAPINASAFSDNGGIVAGDQNGGSPENESKLRCTFSQTRFLVRIWTNPAFSASLLSPLPGSTNISTSSQNSSATDFDRPGSFPYPTTISIDRHGGNINKKAVYCYGVDSLQVIQDNVKTIVPELREVGGQLINPAPPLVNGTSDAGSDTSFDPEAGGIDGGTGGCECLWQNWQ